MIRSEIFVVEGVLYDQRLAPTPIDISRWLDVVQVTHRADLDSFWNQTDETAGPVWSPPAEVSVSMPRRAIPALPLFHRVVTGIHRTLCSWAQRTGATSPPTSNHTSTTTERTMK